MGLIDTIKREVTFMSGLRKTLKNFEPVDPEGQYLVPDDFEASVDKHKANVAIRFEGHLITYGELDAKANQFAHWAVEQGYKPGDCVALFMENKPLYIAFWLGLSKVGVITALINNNLQGQGLAHCVSIAEAKALVVGPEQAEHLASADGLFGGELSLWTLGGDVEGTQRLDPDAAGLSTNRPERDVRANLRGKDMCLYIYTSGTTGLPKAAKLTHARTMGMMRSFIGACRITERDSY